MVRINQPGYPGSPVSSIAGSVKPSHLKKRRRQNSRLLRKRRYQSGPFFFQKKRPPPDNLTFSSPTPLFNPIRLNRTRGCCKKRCGKIRLPSRVTRHYRIPVETLFACPVRYSPVRNRPPAGSAVFGKARWLMSSFSKWPVPATNRPVWVQLYDMILRGCTIRYARIAVCTDKTVPVAFR